ncbi:DUF3160 domain-containing protein [Patescibacteria group bacterium]|nr:DUF3160 domain-containing protein [Patescibacteria group bacterium]
MDSKFKLLIIISVSALILVVLISVLSGYLIRMFNQEPTPNQNINVITNQNPNINSHLPFSIDKFPVGDGVTGVEVTSKERKLFAEYYMPIDFVYTSQVAQYELPINIKTDVLNYRDLSRKINLDHVEKNLENNGFVVTSYPFGGENRDFETAYYTLNNNVIPVLVTVDSVEYLNQVQLYTMFKEIEQEVFYQTVWQVTEKLYNKAKFRFDQYRQGTQIESDQFIEATRLETAFFATALELLKPKSHQIKDEGISAGLEKKFFSPTDNTQYKYNLPDTISSQVNKELQLIYNHNTTTKSPLFLYQKNYNIFTPNTAYQSSEKLKNYSLAAKFYSEALFPLYAKDESCSDCILDKDDHKIATVAAAMIAQDFRDDKEARNLWLKIYKTLSFFQGLEYDFTYLHYLDALIELFGPDFNVENIFHPDNPQFEENLALLQNKLETYSLLEIEGSQKQTAKKGLKLLRSEFSTENFLFNKLTHPRVVTYIGEAPARGNEPSTYCNLSGNLTRCVPTTLDVVSLLDFETATNIIASQNNHNYQNYEANVQKLQDEISQFDRYTWLGNIYWATLQNLNMTLLDIPSTYPTFMQSEVWNQKMLNSVLATRFNLRKKYDIKFFQRKSDDRRISSTIIDYGYVEPFPDYYNSVIALNEMLKNALIDLEIISSADSIIEKLDNNIEILTRLKSIAIKELQNQSLDFDEIEFINKFYKQLEQLIGNLDFSTRNVNFDQRIFTQNQGNYLNEVIENLNLLIVIYKTPNDELILAAGPVFNHYEYQRTKELSSWQRAFIIP